MTEQAERDGPLDGLGDAVAGLADAEDVLDVEARDLDRPAGRVAGDDRFGCRVQVSGDQREAVARGGGGAVAGERDGLSPGGGGDVGWCFDPVAFAPWPAAFPGAG
ncbi:MAG: hypothetical protein ACRDSL_07755 [Pseudonocardiaceae bacterium]